MRPVFEAAHYPDFGPACPFAFSKDRDGVPQEGATVRFAWEKSGLHVLAEMEDAHPIALNREDEQLHYESGDVFELFIKPLNEPYKWEMYATPNGNKSTLFFEEWPSNIPLEDSLSNHRFRHLSVTVEKTAVGWSVRMFVPATQLCALGAGWCDDTEWTVFCGRYNYRSGNLMDPELSMVPALSCTNYHLVDEYARLHMVGSNAAVPAELKSACDIIA